MAATGAHARTLFSEDYSHGGAKGTVRGGVFHSSAGWGAGIEKRVVLPSDPWEAIEYPLNPEAVASPTGTIQFRAKRISPARVTETVNGQETTYDTVFELLYPDNQTAFSVMVMWDFEGDLSRSGLLVNQSWHRGGAVPAVPRVWSAYYPFPRKVDVGEWIHVAMVWGPEPSANNRVYFNGNPLSPVDNPGSGAIVIPPEGNFGDLLKGVDRLRVGVETGLGDLYPGGTSLAVHSAIATIDIQDVMLSSFDLSGIAPTIRSVSDDTFQVSGISGKLVGGDEVSVTLMAVPGGKATFDMGDVKGIALEEVPATEGGPGIPAVDNGTYQGSYTIQPGDDYEDGYIVGHFVSADNVVAEPVASVSKWTIDTKPVVTFDIGKKDIPADSSTKARIKLVAKDANGDSVRGRRLKLTLATTEEYTGTVGAGDFGENVGATVETRWRGETDAWGEVEFDYVAGFAAKTVILTAKDLNSGGVTVDYITAYKEAAIDIALTPPVNRAAARRGVQYIIKVEASRTELTADGRSRSVIRAKVMDPNGAPVAGDPVTFTLSSENGTLRTIKGTTDSSGVAIAEYRAGKKIGIVVVTATATLRNAQGNVSIVLLSDAPAKIYLKARPETLPADGFSRSDLEVKVTDINDNPNQDTKVEFKVSKGGGKLDYADRVTDRFGDATNRYTSGTTPGVATIVATVRSKVPTEAELAKAKNVLFAPYSPEGDEIRVEKWLKKKGDSFVKGEPLVEYTVGRGSTVYVLTASYDGTMGDLFVEYWDNAEVGQTLAVLVPASK
jgi:hypothetical protein